MPRPASGLLGSLGAAFLNGCGAALRASLGLGWRCESCGAALEASQTMSPRAGQDGGGPRLCPACAAALAPRPGGYCPACGELHADPSLPPHLCAACLREPPPWRDFLFLRGYDQPLQGHILAFKFAQALGRQRLLEGLALAAFRHHGGELPDLLAPVPLHSRRLAWRGYNQSLELCRGLSRALGRPLEPQALYRLRHTVPQARLERAARLSNLNGAFAADPARVAGRHALLVDDVSTTGSTLRECARALLSAGAARVDVLVLARA